MTISAIVAFRVSCLFKRNVLAAVLFLSIGGFLVFLGGAAGEMTSGLLSLRRSNLSALIIRRKGLYAGLRRDISFLWELAGRISSSAASCSHVLVFAGPRDTVRV